LDTAYIQGVSGMKIFRTFQSNISLKLTDNAPKPENTGLPLTFTVSD